MVGGALLIALLVALLGLASLLLAPVRSALLGPGLQRAAGSLPGHLTIGSAAWPRAGTVVLTDLVWLAEPPAGGAAADTLAHLRRLDLTIDLRGLRARDLVLDSLAVDLVLLDVPAVTRLLPPRAPAAAAAGSGWSGPWLSEGALAGGPSLALHAADLRAERIRLPDHTTVEGLALAAVAELRRGRLPRVAVTGARARLDQAGARPFGADLTTLDLDATGEDDGWIGIDSLRLEVASAGPPELRSRWRGLEPLRVRLSGRVRPDGSGGEAAIAARVDGPLVSLWPEVWPSLAGGRTLAVLAAEVRLDGRADRDSITLAVAADLAGTPGLERASLAGRASFARAAPLQGRAVVDTLDLAVRGLEVAGSGRFGRDAMAARLRARLRTPCPLLADLLPPAAAVDATATIAAGGSWADPRLDLAVSGGVRGPALTVPRARITVRGGRDDLRVRLNAGGGLLRRDVALADSLACVVRLRPALGPDLKLPPRVAAEVTAEVAGARGFEQARLRARLDFPPSAPLSGSVALDTLDVRYTGLTVTAAGRLDSANVDLAVGAALAAPCPLLELAVPALAGATMEGELALALRGRRDDPRLDLRAGGSFAGAAAVVPRAELELAGDRQRLVGRARSVGPLVVGGRSLADSLALDAVLDTAGPDSLPLGLGALVWQGDRRLGLAGAAAFDSLLVVRLDTLALAAAGQSVRLAAPATVRLDTASRQLEVSRLLLQGEPGTIDLRVQLAAATALVQGKLDLRLSEPMLQSVAPSPFWSRDGGTDLGVAGDVDLDIGRLGAAFSGGLDLRLLPRRDDPRLAATVRFGLAGGDSSGLGAAFAVSAADTVLVHGSLLWPGRVDLARGGWVADPQRLLQVTVPIQAVPLPVMRRLVPPGLVVRGGVRVGADAAIAMPGQAAADSLRAGRLDGTLRSDRLQIDLPNGSRLELVADCTLDGTPAAPRIRGRVTVPSGFVRVPELPRNLHPAEGRPLLWNTTAGDSLAPAPAPTGAAWGPDEEQAAAPAVFPDLDLTVEVPGNLRVHGYGLDVELSAELKVGRGYDERGVPGPALRGLARAEQGTLRFMNRMFTVQRAEVRFTGEVPANPLLDLVLQTQVSGTTVKLLVTGRALAPVIDLTSDPDLNKADIMAYLLFGRPIGELDQEQRGQMGRETDASQQLRENLAGLALAFGTADLQKSVSGTLGVDIVEVGADAGGGTTLTAGKFISPRILLKYNASLVKAGNYFVTLEYALSQVFKLVSTYGQGEEASGLELKWIRRY